MKLLKNIRLLENEQLVERKFCLMSSRSCALRM